MIKIDLMSVNGSLTIQLKSHLTKLMMDILDIWKCTFVQATQVHFAYSLKSFIRSDQIFSYLWWFIEMILNSILLAIVWWDTL